MIICDEEEKSVCHQMMERQLTVLPVQGNGVVDVSFFIRAAIWPSTMSIFLSSQ
jgi:hypothetical protein